MLKYAIVPSFFLCYNIAGSMRGFFSPTTLTPPKRSHPLRVDAQWKNQIYEEEETCLCEVVNGLFSCPCY